MTKKIVLLAFCSLLLARWSTADAEQATKVPRIGYLSSSDLTSDSTTRFEAFRKGLRDLGYIEGQSIVIESRYAQENRDRFPELAAELVHLKVDTIVVAGGFRPILAVKNATKTIPIVLTGLAQILSKQVLLKAWRVRAAMSPALQAFPEI